MLALGRLDRPSPSSFVSVDNGPVYKPRISHGTLTKPVINPILPDRRIRHPVRFGFVGLSSYPEFGRQTSRKREASSGGTGFRAGAKLDVCQLLRETLRILGDFFLPAAPVKTPDVSEIRQLVGIRALPRVSRARENGSSLLSLL